MNAVLDAPELMQRDELRDLTGKAHAAAQAQKPIAIGPKPRSRLQ